MSFTTSHVEKLHVFEQDAVELKCNDKTLENPNEFKLLGITVDKNSNRKEHLNNTTENCYATLIVKSKSKRYIQLPESKQLAESLISSRLDYCNELLFDIPKYMKKNKGQTAATNTL